MAISFFEGHETHFTHSFNAFSAWAIVLEHVWQGRTIDISNSFTSQTGISTLFESRASSRLKALIVSLQQHVNSFS